MNKLNNKAVRDQMRDLALAELYWPRKAPLIVDGHDALYDVAAKTIGPNRELTYLEFGVAAGRSIKKMAERFTSGESRFVGFDSFTGLPEAWLHLPRGAFSAGGMSPEMHDSRVTFVAGWFQDTVWPFLNDLKRADREMILVHFDADIYGSTLYLLSSLWQQLPAYYFIMDDFVHDDAIALFDFASAYPVEISFHAQTRGRGPGPNPDQVFGHIRRVVFRPA